MKERLLRAYFTEGADVGRPRPSWPALAAEVGLDRARGRAAFLASDEGVAEVRDELARGAGAGHHRRADVRVRGPVGRARRAGPRHDAAGATARERAPLRAAERPAEGPHDAPR